MRRKVQELTPVKHRGLFSPGTEAGAPLITKAGGITYSGSCDYNVFICKSPLRKRMVLKDHAYILFICMVGDDMEAPGPALHDLLIRE